MDDKYIYVYSLEAARIYKISKYQTDSFEPGVRVEEGVVNVKEVNVKVIEDNYVSMVVLGDYVYMLTKDAEYPLRVFNKHSMTLLHDEYNRKYIETIKRQKGIVCYFMI
jgi:hypothetical protein